VSTDVSVTRTSGSKLAAPLCETTMNSSVGRVAGSGVLLRRSSCVTVTRFVGEHVDGRGERGGAVRRLVDVHWVRAGAPGVGRLVVAATEAVVLEDDVERAALRIDGDVR
jgi:hypothetical protein